MTAANLLARAGRSVLLVEQQQKLGGLAAWFPRGPGQTFDVALHGFPARMFKSCRRYWNEELASAIVPLRDVRFDNPMFSLSTTFDRRDFTRLLVERFGLESSQVEEFFEAARKLGNSDEEGLTTGQFLERFFPGRKDVIRLLMEPIAFANGSTLDDPATTYGIVFSNFMSQGVYTFRYGTPQLMKLFTDELRRNGVTLLTGTPVEKIHVERRKVRSVAVDGRIIRVRAVVSNANLLGTIFQLVGNESWDTAFLELAQKVRLSNSSTQVYIALKPEASLTPAQCGDVLFSSTAREFRSDRLVDFLPSSRAYSFYYPQTRDDLDRTLIVASAQARYDDWRRLKPEEYQAAKQRLIEDTLTDLERRIPDLRRRVNYVEAATPLTFERYSGHWQGACFGVKYEGLTVSRALPEQIAGLYHVGSVGIIMSGWLGAINYGVLVAHDADAFLDGQSRPNSISEGGLL